MNNMVDETIGQRSCGAINTLVLDKIKKNLINRSIVL